MLNYEQAGEILGKINEGMKIQALLVEDIQASFGRMSSALAELQSILTVPVVKELCALCDRELEAEPAIETGGSKYHVRCHGAESQ